MSLDRELVQTTLRTMRGKRIVVVGDFMLDRYIWGAVKRISPEAPVPVVEVSEDQQRPGGAGNVVLNLTSLGANCIPIGLIGNDDNGRELAELLSSQGASPNGLVVSDDRPTTVKTRVISGNQQLLRVDRERTGLAPQAIQDEVMDRMSQSLRGADAVILQDYNKGLLTRTLIRESISLAREKGVPVTVDPKSSHFFDYVDSTLFKPNLREASNALGREIVSDEDVEHACRELKRRLNAEHVLITRGSQGMTILENEHDPVHIGTKPRRISDVSGAGDTVISTITLALVSGLGPEQAARLATMAAEYVVGRVGVVPITPAALLEELQD
ncbi:D-glycero-beta-D-manno-heptose-7-phosphate kinase [bacterium]|nr:D-glycero-beta-D-manno-heptose-7-phosphate kinase [bacterium]